MIQEDRDHLNGVLTVKIAQSRRIDLKSGDASPPKNEITAQEAEQNEKQRAHDK